MLTALLPGAGLVGARQSSPLLPQHERFIAEVRAHLRTDEDLQSQYTYIERRQDIRVSKLGKVRLGDVRLFEVYPSPEPGQTDKRLIEVNGRPLDPEALRQRDEARREFLADRALIGARETPAERAERERTEADARQKQQDIIDDVFRVYEIDPVGREPIDGHQTIVATLTPRSGVSTRSQAGKYFSRFRGRAWVSEDDDQLIKVELEAFGDILVGWGVLGRIHEGSRLTFERRKVNDEVWLPSRMSIQAAGRVLLFRTFRVESVTEFFDYKKFLVTTGETYTAPR